ncbi:MAG: transposase [Aridibacter famidurans]|nr:transposase [Aridibacter famidurans]
MKHISKDSPLLFLTFITNQRLPVFRTEALAEIAAKAFDEARNSGGFSIYSYVILPDHVHMITGSERSPSDTLRFLKGISARRVIGHLKEEGHASSLGKLTTRRLRGPQTYSLWQHHSNTFTIMSERMLMQKVSYIHLNPTKEELAELPSEYRFSSARIWERRPMEDEPIEIDLSDIMWSKQ